MKSKMFHILSLSIMFVCRMLIEGYQIRYFSIIPGLLRIFIIRRCWLFFSNYFTATTEIAKQERCIWKINFWSALQSNLTQKYTNKKVWGKERNRNYEHLFYSQQACAKHHLSESRPAMRWRIQEVNFVKDTGSKFCDLRKIHPSGWANKLFWHGHLGAVCSSVEKRQMISAAGSPVCHCFACYSQPTLLTRAHISAWGQCLGKICLS